MDVTITIINIPQYLFIIISILLLLLLLLFIYYYLFFIIDHLFLLFTIFFLLFITYLHTTDQHKLRCISVDVTLVEGDTGHGTAEDVGGRQGGGDYVGGREVVGCLGIGQPEGMHEVEGLEGEERERGRGRGGERERLSRREADLSAYGLPSMYVFFFYLLLNP